VDISSNKLLPILGTVVILFILGIAIKSCQREEIPVAVAKPAPPADADSPADTLTALQAEVAHVRLEEEHMRNKLTQESQHQEQLSHEIAAQVKAELAGSQNTGFDALLQRVDELSTKYAQSSQNNGNKALGSASVDPDFSLSGPPASIKVEPLNSASLLEKLGNSVAGLKNKAVNALPTADGSLLHDIGNNSIIQSHLPHDGGASGTGTVPVRLPEPVYTVPRNSTLVGSTGMTALIGRIPVKGNVDDPYPFKVIVGSDNLAANGLEMPGLDGMIFTGHAIGDWTLSCVRGEIHSVTFVFEDGTIRTLSSDDQSLQQKSLQSAQAQGQPNATSGNSNGNKPLGWLSDRRGIPCITGARITNAPQYLGGRFLASVIGAAGNAYARSQTTINTTPLGGITQGVTGNPQSYALGAIASGGANELADWITERQAQSYDAVFVDTGAEIAIHVDRELPIDFEPYGRKLTYARKKHGAPKIVAALD